MAFSPDGKQVASGSWDKSLKVWNAETGTELSTLNVDSAVMSVAYSPSGDTVAVGCWDGTVAIVDAFTGRVKRSVRGVKQINCVAFSPDGKILAVGNGDFFQSCNVLLCDPATGEVKLTLTEHFAPVTSIAWNNHGTKLAIGTGPVVGYYWTVKIWSVGSAGTFECQSTLGGHSER